jgi:predicted nucleic acid-binding protein
VIFVVDTSAAMEVLLNRPNGDRLVRQLADAEEVIAPDRLFAEAANALGKSHRFQKLALDVCERALEELEGLVDRTVPCRELYRDAFALARTSQRSAYDMFYLALARREAATLVTLDAALKKEAEHQGIPTA